MSVTQEEVSSDLICCIKNELEAADLRYYNLSCSGIKELFYVLLWPVGNDLASVVEDDSIQEVLQYQEELTTNLLDLSKSGSERSCQDLLQLQEEERTRVLNLSKSRYRPPFYCESEFFNLSIEIKVNQLVKYHMMLKSEKEYYKSISNRRVRCGKPIRPMKQPCTIVNKESFSSIHEKANESSSDQVKLQERQGSKFLDDTLNESFAVSSANQPSSASINSLDSNVNVPVLNEESQESIDHVSSLIKKISVQVPLNENIESDKPNECSSAQLQVSERPSLLNDALNFGVLNTKPISIALSYLIHRRVNIPLPPVKQGSNTSILLPHSSNKNIESNKSNESASDRPKIPKEQGSSCLDDASNKSFSALNINRPSTASTSYVEPERNVSVSNRKPIRNMQDFMENAIVTELFKPSSSIRYIESDRPNEPLSDRSSSTASTSYVEPERDASNTRLIRSVRDVTDNLITRLHSCEIRNNESDRPNDPPSDRPETHEGQSYIHLDDDSNNSSIIMDVESLSQSIPSHLEHRVDYATPPETQGIFASNILQSIDYPSDRSESPEGQGSSHSDGPVETSSTLLNVPWLRSYFSEFLGLPEDNSTRSEPQIIPTNLISQSIEYSADWRNTPEGQSYSHLGQVSNISTPVLNAQLSSLTLTGSLEPYMDYSAIPVTQSISTNLNSQPIEYSADWWNTTESHSYSYLDVLNISNPVFYYSTQSIPTNLISQLIESPSDLSTTPGQCYSHLDDASNISSPVLNVPSSSPVTVTSLLEPSIHYSRTPVTQSSNIPTNLLPQTIELPSDRPKTLEGQGSSFLQAALNKSSPISNIDPPSSVLKSYIDRAVDVPSSPAKRSIKAANLLPTEKDVEEKKMKKMSQASTGESVASSSVVQPGPSGISRPSGSGTSVVQPGPSGISRPSSSSRPSGSSRPTGSGISSGGGGAHAVVVDPSIREMCWKCYKFIILKTIHNCVPKD